MAPPCGSSKACGSRPQVARPEPAEKRRPHEVQDAAAWESAYRSHGDLFRTQGTSSSIQLGTNSKNVVGTYEQTADVEKLLASLDSPETHEAMKADGVKADTVSGAAGQVVFVLVGIRMGCRLCRISGALVVPWRSSRPGYFSSSLLPGLISTLLLCPIGASAATPRKADQAGTLRAGGVVLVATKSDLQSSSDFKGLVALGVEEASIADGTMLAVRILCCRDSVKASGVTYLYNPGGLPVAPGDFVEFRIGTPGAKEPQVRLNVLTRVLQPADTSDGACWWEPRQEGLWLRFVQCDWMPAEGWISEKGTWTTTPTWYKPAKDVASD